MGSYRSPEPETEDGMKRSIIEIDRALCDGCGLCTTACAEGALALDEEGKAVLLKEIFCDGLGACLDVCPTGALTVSQKDVPAYDENAAADHVRAIRGDEAASRVHRTGQPQGAGIHVHAPSTHMAHSGGGCPGSAMRSFAPAAKPAQARASADPGIGQAAPSELGQWPVQLGLVSPQAPYFNGCDLLIAADCTAFALGSFHRDLLAGKKLAIACPKLDETETYVAKIAELLRINTIYSLTVAIMEVPCCSGLKRIVEEAAARSGKSLAVKTVVVGIQGSMA